MRCGIRLKDIPNGAGCSSPGQFNPGCIYEVPWFSLALADTSTDATLKYVPRSGIQAVLGFLVDVIQPVQAATGPGAGPLEGQAGYMTALTRNSISYLPLASSSSGAAVTTRRYPLAAFARAVQQRAGGVMKSLDSGEGTPWAQFGLHKLPLGIQDDITVTIENQTGLAADFGGTFVVLQVEAGSDMATGVSSSANTQ